MSNLNKKGTKDLIIAATRKISKDIDTLQNDKGNALSEFRKAADRLGSIHEQLLEKVNDLSNLETFIQDKKNVATQNISDNAAVRSKILDIIGE